LIQRSAAFSEVEVAHFSFDPARITLATAGNGEPASHFSEHAVDPGLALLRGE